MAIETAGHGRYETMVDIKAGETAKVDAELTATAIGGPGSGGAGGGEAKPGGTSRALFWVAAGVSAVSVAGFSVTGLQVWGHRDEVERISDEGTFPDNFSSPSDNPCDGFKGFDGSIVDDLAEMKGHCDDGKSKQLITNVLIGVAVASGLAAGYFFYDGYLQADSGERAVARRNKKASQPTVKLTPTVTPDYFGAGVKIEF